jgi:hypothetical protein
LWGIGSIGDGVVVLVGVCPDGHISKRKESCCVFC